MKVERQNSDGTWERVASTGNALDYPISITRLHDLNTVFSFISFPDGRLYRVYLPDRDWMKRTDIVPSQNT